MTTTDTAADAVTPAFARSPTLGAVRETGGRARARFHTLRVADVRPLTPTAIEVTFAVPDELVDAFDYALIDGNLRMETLHSLARHGANSAAFNAEMVRRLAQACPIDQEEREVLRDVAGAEAFLAAARA